MGNEFWVAICFLTSIWAFLATLMWFVEMKQHADAVQELTDVQQELIERARRDYEPLGYTGQTAFDFERRSRWRQN